MQPRGSSWLSWVAAVSVLATAGCSSTGDEAKLSSAGVATGSDTSGSSDLGAVDTITLGSDDAAADTGPQASCAGSALVAGFAAKDPECSFLKQCSTLGKCYCGDTCAADKQPKCDPSLCPTSAPKCWCGELCQSQGKTPLCSEAQCAGYTGLECVQRDSCTYVNKEPPSWCGCTKMDPIKKCWCNSKLCAEPREECPPQKCVGKPTDKCILVPGDKPTSCWCDTCGLVGDTPKCFFVLCPGGG